MTQSLRNHLMHVRYDAARKRTYVALDVARWTDARVLVEQLGEVVDGYKVGLQLFHGDGAMALNQLRQLGKRVFLDVKLHDIPNTVAGALQAICEYGVEMVNIHATGGRKMMEAARAAVDTFSKRPLLIGVTALTSLSEADLDELNLPASGDWVNQLARLAMDCGLNGVVASALDIERIRTWSDASFEIVVPGTRPTGAALNDQARSATPGDAIQSGASRLVLGRALTQSADPLQTLQVIWDEMLQALETTNGGVQGGGTGISR